MSRNEEDFGTTATAGMVLRPLSHTVILAELHLHVGSAAVAPRVP